MNSFVDFRKISSYSNALAEKLISDWFVEKHFITGIEIKSFCKIDQVNMFILSNLFEKWQEETSKLRSPYFNYDTPEVQQAIKNLLNVLSNQIQVAKEFFKPLLTKSIEDTLLLALDPIVYFERHLSIFDNINKDTINQIRKFQKINLNYIDLLAESIDPANVTPLRKTEAIDILKHSGLTPDENSQILDWFSSHLRIETKDIFLEPEITNAPVYIPEQLKPEFEESEDKAIAHEFESTENIDYQPKEIVWEKQKEIEDPQIKIQPAQFTEAPKPENIPTNLGFLKNLLSHSKGESTLFKQKISDLRAEIPLSDKFLFIRELFNDEPSSFAETLFGLEKCSNLDEAVNYLEVNCVLKYKWTKDNPFIPQFLTLLEKRFS